MKIWLKLFCCCIAWVRWNQKNFTWKVLNFWEHWHAPFIITKSQRKHTFVLMYKQWAFFVYVVFIDTWNIWDTWYGFNIYIETEIKPLNSISKTSIKMAWADIRFILLGLYFDCCMKHFYYIMIWGNSIKLDGNYYIQYRSKVRVWPYTLRIVIGGKADSVLVLINICSK